MTQTATAPTSASYAGGCYTFRVSRHPSGQGPVRIDTTAGQEIARFEPVGDGHVRIVDVAESMIPDRVQAGDAWTLACVHAENLADLADAVLSGNVSF